jgi:hypothetical protein
MTFNMMIDMLLPQLKNMSHSSHMDYVAPMELELDWWKYQFL